MPRNPIRTSLLIGCIASAVCLGQPVEAPWQPVSPATSPLPIENGAAASTIGTVQHTVSYKPADGAAVARSPGGSPYYTSALTLAPVLAPSANFAPSTMGYSGQTTAWWDGNQWVATSPNQAMPMPTKFPAIITSAPVTTTAPQPNAYAATPQNSAVAFAGQSVAGPLPSAPSTAAQQPGAPLAAPPSTPASASAPTAPTAAASPASQTTVAASPRPSAPFVDEALFMAGGQSWREYDLTPYTSRFVAEDRPEHAIRRWILAQTGGPGAWFGHETTALKISRDRLQAYQTPEMQARIAEVLGRFLYYTPGRFRCRVRVYNLANVKSWRSEFQPRMEPAGARTPGRQAWLISPADANQFVNKYDGSAGGYLLGDQRLVIGNGQDAVVTMPLSNKSYVRDVLVDSGNRGGQFADASYRLQSEEIADGVRIRFSPLIATDATTIELDVQASALKVEKTKQVALDAAGRPKVEVPAIATAMLDERIEIKEGKYALLSLGLGPNLDPRFRPFKKERAELVVLLEINPDSANTINGAPIPRQMVASSSPAGSAGRLPPPRSRFADFPPAILTQKAF